MREGQHGYVHLETVRRTSSFLKYMKVVVTIFGPIGILVEKPVVQKRPMGWNVY